MSKEAERDTPMEYLGQQTNFTMNLPYLKRKKISVRGHGSIVHFSHEDAQAMLKENPNMFRHAVGEYECDHCGAEFKDKGSLTRHMGAQHATDENTEVEDAEVKAAAEKLKAEATPSGDTEAKPESLTKPATPPKRKRPTARRPAARKRPARKPAVKK